MRVCTHNAVLTRMSVPAAPPVLQIKSGGHCTGVHLFFNDNGALHREDGPAHIDLKTGASMFFLHGLRMFPYEHRYLRRRNALLRGVPRCIVQFM